MTPPAAKPDAFLCLASTCASARGPVLGGLLLQPGLLDMGAVRACMSYEDLNEILGEAGGGDHGGQGSADDRPSPARAS